MTSWPNPTRSDLDKFCQTEGWTPVRDSRGRTGTHHVTYEFGLPDGSTLRTRISHSPDRTDIGPALWSHILRDQLRVTEAEFWSCVKDGTRPRRAGNVETRESLPAELAYLLIHRVGLSDDKVAEMSRDEAVVRLDEYWITGA
jgi:hypothetical protein